MILQINSQPPLAVNVPIMITPNLRHDPSLLIDVKDFMPVAVSSTDKNNIRIHSSFSLASLDRDAGERLRALVDFIRISQMASTHGLYIGCTHAIAEQGMSSLQMPNEDEIREAYRQGEAAVIALFQTTFLAMVESIQKLEDQLAKNSRNRDKPPSDGYDQGAPRPRSLRKRSRRKSGGQPGHPGETLKTVKKPDVVKVHRVQACQHCGQSLKRRKAVDHEKQQVYDLPKVTIQVT